MKNFTLALLFALSPIFTFGQFSTVVDFTSQDINGTVHHLQQYLDDGKYVVVDLSATWCGPCHNLHQSGVLDDLHNNYGPPGTDEMVVLWVEIDPSTDTADIYGNTGSSQGDFTNGGTFPVPIIDDASIANSFDLYDGGVPSVFLVCPSGDYKDITSQAWSGEAAVYGELSSCPVTLNANFQATQTTINPGDCIDFEDLSTGSPTAWDWTFNGAATGSSTDQDPTGICYNIPGTYDVTLSIEDGSGGTSDETKVAYITVNDYSALPGAYFTANHLVVPEGGIVQFIDTSTNGPFVSWAWTFEGGLPATSTDSSPQPVAYLNAGLYDVELRVEHASGDQYVNLKEDYIKVVPPADDPPTADFIASYTVIAPGESIDFHDISTGNPYQWEWTFESGIVNYSEDQNPTGITYPAAGSFDVMMIAKNSEGNDTIVKEDYIVVSDTDPCTTSPIADFRATNRLISAGETIFFQDLSTNYPSTWVWTFDQGMPSVSTEGSPMSGVEYNVPGIYDVRLNVNNSCGGDASFKEDYIYVFSGPIPKYCDTMTNMKGSEIPTKISYGQWGYIAGHNSDMVRQYADYYDSYSFTQIEGLIVPVHHAVNGQYNSAVKFYIWDGDTQYPTDSTILAEKTVFLRNIPENYNFVVNFDNPVEIDGPFFIGFKISYPDNNNNGVSDDNFVVSVAPSRGASQSQNTMYVYKGGEWKSSVAQFGISTSLAIKPIACLVDIDELDVYTNIHTYPNPTTGKITLELGEEYRDKQIEVQVFDLTGRMLMIDTKVYSNTEYNIDFTDQTPGMYFLNVYVDGKKVSKKISVIR